ncbi:MAG: hypothetical protein ACTSRU_20315, partial [Candidatus Hodarchaeales archaeon]
MTLQISALDMFTKHAEIVRKFLSQSMKTKILNKSQLQKSDFGSSRSLLRTVSQARMLPRKDGNFFSGGFGLVNNDNGNLIPTAKAQTLIELGDEVEWGIMYLLGLGIGCFPRVRALYDLLLEGATINYEILPGQKPFPQFGVQRMESSTLQEQDNEPVEFLEAITSRIQEHPDIYIGQTYASSNANDLNSIYIIKNSKITWNATTNRSFMKLCGYGQEFISRFYDVEVVNSNHRVKLDISKFLSNKWIRRGLDDCVGFSPLLSKARSWYSLSQRG